MAVHVDVQKNLGEFQLNIKFESGARRIGLLGASGCGKSMLLKSIAGIETPDSGKIMMDGRILYDSSEKVNVKPQKRNVGYLFQNYALFPTMTVADNIAAGLKGDKSSKKKKVLEISEKFRITELLDRFPEELSGGQQQRTALARIMAYEPEIILLDEPYTALDMFLKDRLQQELMEMLCDYEGTVILVSHNRDEIYRFSEELVVVDGGRVEVSGRTKEIFADPETKEAARLTGCKNIVAVKCKGGHFMEIPEWGITLHTRREIPKDIAYIGYRAHEFVPVWGERKENCIKVRVQSTSELPFEYQYYLIPEKYLENGATNETICWYVQKNLWTQIKEKGFPDYLELKEEQLLFLKNSF